jgi:hypothetical protein
MMVDIRFQNSCTCKPNSTTFRVVQVDYWKMFISLQMGYEMTVIVMILFLLMMMMMIIYRPASCIFFSIRKCTGCLCD